MKVISILYICERVHHHATIVIILHHIIIMRVPKVHVEMFITQVTSPLRIMHTSMPHDTEAVNFSPEADLYSPWRGDATVMLHSIPQDEAWISRPSYIDFIGEALSKRILDFESTRRDDKTREFR